MTVSFDRMSQDIQQIATSFQQSIGQVSEALFGYTTTPETNAFLMYALLALLVVVAGRIFGPVNGTVKGAKTPQSARGYDFRRYG